MTEEGAKREIKSAGSYGWGGFFTTDFWVDPKEQLIGVMMLQMYPFDDWELYPKFRNMVYASIKEPIE